MGDRPPIWEEGVELEGRVWYPVNAHHNTHNLSSETRNAIALRLRANRIANFAWGTVPEFEGGFELGGRV